MDCSESGSSVHGTFQARMLEWVAISYSRGASQPRDGTHISCISCIGRQILYHCVTCILGFPCGSAGKESACYARDLGLILGWEDSLEKEKATHSSILAWRIPQTV